MCVYIICWQEYGESELEHFYIATVENSLVVLQ